ncbi:MAG: VOC family protein [Chitinophagales bacterium]
MFAQIEFILYVADQERSAAFYEALLQQPPVLNVPGMTEFALNENCKLGLMPNKGIVKILGDSLPHPDTGNGIPRCELYLHVSDVNAMYEHAEKIGAKLISAPELRTWNEVVCYIADPDGHVIAFAQKQ